MKNQITFLFFLISFFIYSQEYTEAQLKALSKTELEELINKKRDSTRKALESRPRTIIEHFIKSDGEKVNIYNLKIVSGVGKKYTLDGSSQQGVYDPYKNGQLEVRGSTIGDELGFADYGLSAQFLWYHDKEGNVEKIAQSKISTFTTAKDFYTRLKIGSVFGFKRLHRKVIEAESHLLTEYFSGLVYYYYLYDKTNNTFLFKKEKGDKVKKNRKLFEQSIKPYFKNCLEFIEKVNTHLSKDYSKRFSPNKLIEKNLFGNISNIDCY